MKVRVMVFNTTFNNIMAVSFIGRGHQSIQEKTIDLSQVTDSHIHYRVQLIMSEVKEWMLLNAMRVIFSHIIGENKLSYSVNRMMMHDVCFVPDQHLKLIFLELLAHCNNSPYVDMHVILTYYPDTGSNRWHIIYRY